MVVLPVFNATGRRLQIARQEPVEIFEGILPEQGRPGLTVPDLIQAGFILGLDAADRKPAAMAWTNEQLPASPESIEAVRAASREKGLEGDVVWITVTDWDARDWRQQGAVLISGEVAWFNTRDPASLRTRSFHQYRLVIPPFSSLAQVAGHVGIRLAQLTQ